MLPNQRYKQILQRVERVGGARVSDLAQALSVTEETIRRDLNVLSDQGKLVRTHGGAIPLAESSAGFDLPHAQRAVRHLEAKRAIARHALELTQGCSVMALDASTTALQLARLLPDRACTVVTNAVTVCETLGHHRQTQVICTGGEFDLLTRSLVGFASERTIAGFHIERFFCSCMGLDPKRGLTDSSPSQAFVKSRFIEQAEETILLADHTKVTTRSRVYSADWSGIDRLVMDRSDISEVNEVLARVQERGVSVELIDLAENAG